MRPDDQDRVELFPADGPLELDVDVLSGRVEVRLEDDRAEAEVTVSRMGPGGTAGGTAGDAGAQAGPDAGPTGLSGLLSWVGDQFTDAAAAEAAVERAEITRTGNQLRVRAVRQLPMRLVPLHVRVTAPTGSAVRVRTGGAAVRVDGVPDGVDVVTGSGELTVAAVAGGTVLRTGVGAIAVGTGADRVRAEAGRGEISIEDVQGAASVTTGDGDVRVGGVHGNLMVRTGHGEITVRSVVAGDVDLTSGSGDLRVGLPSGVLAEVDLQGTRGHPDSEVPVHPGRPEGTPAVRVRGRTGAGRVALTRSGRG